MASRKELDDSGNNNGLCWQPPANAPIVFKRVSGGLANPGADPPQKKARPQPGSWDAPKGLEKGVESFTAQDKRRGPDLQSSSATRAKARRKESLRRDLNKMQRQWIEPPKPVPSRKNTEVAKAHAYAPAEPKRRWVRLFLDTLEHPAYRGLSINARRILDRLTIELHRCGGIENGALRVSHADFVAFGVTRQYIGGASDELETAGLIWSTREPQKHPLLPSGRLYGLTAYKPEHRKDQSGAFAWVYLDVLESKAWRDLSLGARRVLDRLLIENARHWYRENGRLRVSMRQLAGPGKGQKHVIKAIRELEKAGLLAVARDRPRGKFAPANLYRLRFVGTVDGPPDWHPAAGEKTESRPQKDSTARPQKDSTRGNGDASAPSGEPAKRLSKRIASITSSLGPGERLAPPPPVPCPEPSQAPPSGPNMQIEAFKARAAQNRPEIASREPVDWRLVRDVNGGYRRVYFDAGVAPLVAAIEAEAGRLLIAANSGEGKR
jgi:hypothetical protein